MAEKPKAVLKASPKKEEGGRESLAIDGITGDTKRRLEVIFEESIKGNAEKVFGLFKPYIAEGEEESVARFIRGSDKHREVDFIEWISEERLRVNRGKKSVTIEIAHVKNGLRNELISRAKRGKKGMRLKEFQHVIYGLTAGK